MHCVDKILTDVAGASKGFWGLHSPSLLFIVCWYFEMGLIGCPRTSVINLHCVTSQKSRDLMCTAAASLKFHNFVFIYL